MQRCAITALATILATTFIMAGCGDSNDFDPIGSSALYPAVVTGLVVQDAEGNTVEIWGNPSSSSSGYPNPTDGSISFNFMVPGPATVDAWVVTACAKGNCTDGVSTELGGNYFSVPQTRVSTLMTGSVQGGEYRIVWGGNGDDGQALPDGLYRVYFSANGLLFWSDILIARSPGTVTHYRSLLGG